MLHGYSMGLDLATSGFSVFIVLLLLLVVVVVLQLSGLGFRV